MKKFLTRALLLALSLTLLAGCGSGGGKEQRVVNVKFAGSGPNGLRSMIVR